MVFFGNLLELNFLIVDPLTTPCQRSHILKTGYQTDPLFVKIIDCYHSGIADLASEAH